MKIHKADSNLIRFRDDFVIDISLIDSMIYTDTNPDNKEKWDGYKWLIYCKRNNKWNWFTITDEAFNKVKRYIKNFN